MKTRTVLTVRTISDMLRGLLQSFRARLQDFLVNIIIDDERFLNVQKGLSDALDELSGIRQQVGELDEAVRLSGIVDARIAEMITSIARTLHNHNTAIASLVEPVEKEKRSSTNGITDLSMKKPPVGSDKPN